MGFLLTGTRRRLACRTSLRSCMLVGWQAACSLCCHCSTALATADLGDAGTLCTTALRSSRLRGSCTATGPDGKRLPPMVASAAWAFVSDFAPMAS